MVMRILHVIPQFPYFGGRTVVGGHASAVHTLSWAQAARGHEVTVLSFVQGRHGSMRLGDNFLVVSLFEGATLGTVRFAVRFVASAVRWIIARRKEFDVVHCHSGFVDYLVMSNAVMRASRLPTLHTLYCPVARGGSRANRPLLRSLLVAAGRQLDRIVAISGNVERSLREFGLGPEHQIDVVPPPVDLDRFCPEEGPSPLRSKLGVGSEDVVVLFVGNASVQKNLERVLEAFAKVRAAGDHMRLVVTTELPRSSPNHRLLYLRNLMEELGITDSVVQLGIIGDMPELMRACDLLVAPFLDSYGPSDYFLAVLEAMATGKATVVANVGGMPEVVGAQLGRLVNPQSSCEIAGALSEYARDPESRKLAGKKAREFAEKTFAAPRVADEYDRIYGELVPC
jgi:glycosyltransferase involved in cell wall biosynthesis